MYRLPQFAALLFACLLVACLLVPAATLQQLTMDEMTQQATAVVRARVAGSYTSTTNSTIYTHYKLQVSEAWKGVAPAEVMVPGGIDNGARQSFPGVPELQVGGEYVLYLWKSGSTGIVHLLGLSQGVFNVTQRADGTLLAGRAKIGEMMLDAAGRKVIDQAVSMPLLELKARVRPGRVSAGAGR